MRLAGCYVAIVTPFNEQGVDEASMSAHVEWLIEAGVSGIVVCGTTGEAATMSNPEKLKAIAVVREAMAGRGTLIAGAGNNSTSESLEFIAMLEREGGPVDVIMSVVPYYNKPNQAGLVGHFEAIADASANPVLLYNVPARTITSMSVETIAHLCRHANVVGIKEASADLFFDALVHGAIPDDVSMLSGDDATALPFMAVGGAGVISVAGNVAPALMVELCQAVQAGDLPRARKLNHQVARLQQLLFRVSNPIPVKAACARLGFGNGSVRLPLARLPEDEEQALCDELEREGLRR